MATNKNKKKLRAPKVADSELSRVITDIYDELNKLSGGPSEAATQNIRITSVSQSQLPANPEFDDVTVDTLLFNTAYLTGGNEAQGTLYWNSDEESLSLVTNGQTTEIGQKVEIQVKNQTGAQINKGEVVYASGTVGSSGRILVTKMIADGTVAAQRVLGIAAENIANGANGKVVKFGKIKNINLSSFNDGDLLYVSSTTAGALQNTEPSQANGHVSLQIAYVIHAANNGQVFVRVTPIDENEYQDYDAGLQDISSLTPSDDTIIVGNGTNWVAESGDTARASLGLTIGTHVQAWDAQLDDIAGLTPTDGNFIVGNGTNFVAESGNTARTSLGLGTSDDVQFDDITATGIIYTDEIDTTSIVWSTSTEVFSTSTEKFNNPVFIGTSLDVDNGINADQHIHAGTYLKADIYLEVGTSATIGTTLDVTGATTLSTLDVTSNTIVGGTLNVTGNTTISGTLDAPTLNTGQGDNELYAMNQDVQTTDGVIFDTLSVTNSATIGSTLDVTGGATFNTSILLDATAKFESEEGYLSGFTGNGFNLSKVSSLYRLELDDMFIRGALFASEFIINQITAINGSDILSAGRGKIESIVDATVGAEVLKVGDPTNDSGAEISNFVAGDIVIVQQVQPNQSQLVKRIIRLVSSVSGNEITLESATAEPPNVIPSDAGTFAVGDIIVAIGSESDTNRQANIYRTVIEENSPYVRVNDGIELYSDWTGYDKVKLQYGRLDSLTSLHSNVSGYGFYGENTFLTGALLVGDLSKSGNYLEYNGSSLNVVTGTFNLATSTLVIDSANNKIALGALASSITIDGTEVGFIADGAGEFKAYADANNYIRLSNSALDIKAESFDLETNTVVLNSASVGRLIVGSDADNQLVNDGIGFFVDGNGNFRVGNIQQGADSYITFDGSTVSILTNTFDLDATTLIIDSSTNSGKIALGATPPTAYNSGTGIYFDGTGKALIGNASGNKIQFNGTSVDIQSTSFNLSGEGIDIDTAGTGIADPNVRQTNSSLAVNWKASVSASPQVGPDFDISESERLSVLQIVFDYDIVGGDTSYEFRIEPQFRNASTGVWASPSMNYPIVTYPSASQTYYNTNPLSGTLTDTSGLFSVNAQFTITAGINLSDKVVIYIAADPESIDYATYDGFRFIVYNTTTETQGSFTADMYVRKYSSSVGINPNGFSIRQADTIWQETVLMQDKLPIRQDKTLLFV